MSHANDGGGAQCELLSKIQCSYLQPEYILEIPEYNCGHNIENLSILLPRVAVPRI